MHAVWVNVIESIEVALSIPSIFLLLYMILCTSRFHINFRILLTILCLSFLLYDSARLTLLIFTFVCGHEIPLRVTIACSSTFGIASVAYSATFSMLGAERCFATYRVHDYEKSSGMLGRICTLFLALIFISIPVFIVSSFKGSMLAGTVAVFSEALLLFFLSLTVYRMNFQLQNILSRLTKKYQVAENIEASSTLLLISLVWLSLEIPALICLLVILLCSITQETPSYWLLVNIYYLCNATYTLLFPWMFMMRVPKYRKTLLGWVSRGDKVASEEEKEEKRKTENEAYFQSINNQWGTRVRSRSLSLTKIKRT